MPASAAEKEPASVRFAKDQLKAFVERIEKLEEEKKAISDDIRDVYAESKIRASINQDSVLPRKIELPGQVPQGRRSLS